MGSPNPKLTLGWSHEFSRGLTEKFCTLGHNFQSTVEFRSWKDHGPAEHKAHGTDFHMIEELSLHYAYTQRLQEVWNQ